MSTLTSLTAKLFGKKGSRPGDPGRDWLLLLLCGFIFLLVSVGWNVWFFNQVVTEETNGAGGATGALDAYDADSVKELFDMRASSAEAYRSVHVFVDPSR
jgi:hypothetical protein